MIYLKALLLAAVCSFLGTICVSAQNPIITDQFTADPSARVFNAKVYLYPSHDIPPVEGQKRENWFCMQDYHVFSSENLTDWTDHGVIISQYSVPWVDSTAYSMWAPDCIGRDGMYYFYFPTPPKENYGRGFRIGVAIADHPSGPFTPQPDPIENVHGIDPNVFVDKDGQAYLYWAGRGGFYAAALKDNMVELASEPKSIKGLPDEGLKEGPFVFERNNVYYMTFPHVADSTERLEYAIGDNPLGPFEPTGIIMEQRLDCWTNHHSIIEFKDQWYLFYHNNDLSPQFDKNRSVRIDSLFFNKEGTIQSVIPTLRGVGLTNASQKIQIDRYSQKSQDGTSIAFMDPLNTFEGWKTILDEPNAWIQYNAVDFGQKHFKTVHIRARSKTGCTLHVKLNKIDNQAIAHVNVPESKSWKIVGSPLTQNQVGIHNLIVLNKDQDVEIDWIHFSK
ncbi:MAG: family 43 glycosylhydrolase [candidate division KSB1 bacterium]|nr:family 43 glycosylhydrolase [candidate division KSB1 bacterium]